MAVEASTLPSEAKAQLQAVVDFLGKGTGPAWLTWASKSTWEVTWEHNRVLRSGVLLNIEVALLIAWEFCGTMFRGETPPPTHQLLIAPDGHRHLIWTFQGLSFTAIAHIKVVDAAP